MENIMGTVRCRIHLTVSKIIWLTCLSVWASVVWTNYPVPVALAKSPYNSYNNNNYQNYLNNNPRQIRNPGNYQYQQQDVYQTSPGNNDSNSNGNNTVDNCNRFQEITTIDQVSLSTIHVVHFLSVPMIVAYGIGADMKDIARWYTFNVTTNKYEINQISNCVVDNAAIRGFDSIERKGRYFAAGAVDNLDQKNPVVSSVLPSPSSIGLYLNQPSADKLSQAAILSLNTTDPNDYKFNVHQMLVADDVGPILVFKLYTAVHSAQDCALFTILNKNEFFKVLIYCFYPNDFRPDDQAVHFLQQIQIKVSPLLTSVEVRSKTLLLITNCDAKYRMTGPASFNDTIHGNVVNVWVHEPRRQTLLLESRLPIKDIISIDSQMTSMGTAFLAVGSLQVDASVSGNGTDTLAYVYIYWYDTKSKRFVGNEILQVKNLIQVRFQLVFKTGELYLFALSSDAVNNIHIYSLKRSYTWKHLCSITVAGASQIETSSFAHEGQFRSHVIAVTPSGATVVDTQLQ